MCKYKACKEYLVKTEKKSNIELDITTWYLIDILDKELDISDIKT